ncbi:MAG: tetratricopeptide repeat protein [Limisphaerales bacterium]
MPDPLATPERISPAGAAFEPPIRRGLRHAKVAVLLVALLVLGYLGHRGRRDAELQLRLGEIASLGDQLARQLHDEQRPLLLEEPTNGPAGAGAPTQAVATLSGSLKTLLASFDATYDSTRLSAPRDFEVRLARATLALAERRFADALTLVGVEASEVANGQSRAGSTRSARELAMRAGGHFGLREWNSALDLYRQVLARQTNAVFALARTADCLLALQQFDAAVSEYSRLARTHADRGTRLLLRGKTENAIGTFGRAIAIESRLVERKAGSALALASYHNRCGHAVALQGNPGAAGAHHQNAVKLLADLRDGDGMDEASAGELAASHGNCGNAFLLQGKSDEAIAHYGTAIEIRSRWVGREGREDQDFDLALDHQHRGDALLARQRLENARTEYDASMAIFARLASRASSAAGGNDLAVSHGHRGVVHRAMGNLPAALADFDAAIAIFATLVSSTGQGESTRPPPSRDPAAPGTVRLDVAVGYSENAMDVLMRTRLVEAAARPAPAVAFATALRNRGFALLSAGKAIAALEDFRRGIEVYARLVGGEGRRDLSPQFAKFLTSLAWIQATHADPAIRDGPRARDYALRACQLTDWKILAPIEALAASCAETGDYAGAVRWQERVIELAPVAARPSHRARLELYRSGQPHRTPAVRAAN